MVAAMTVHKVAIVIHDGVQALDVAGPMDTFIEANNFVPAENRYEVMLVARNLEPVRASNNMQMLADVSFTQANEDFGILLVAGGPRLPDALPDTQMVEYLRMAACRATIHGSVCTGAFPLGHAGL